MSWLGIVLVSVFSANALLVYGFGIAEASRPREALAPLSLLALGAATLASSALLWLARTFLLEPLGLVRFEVLVFVLVIAPLLKYLSQAASRDSATPIGSFLARVDEAMMSSLVFGIALVATRSGFSLGEALLASVASSLGFGGAFAILGGIRRRLELSGLPRGFREGPALLLSAGLLAMVFSGIDARLLAGLVK